MSWLLLSFFKPRTNCFRKQTSIEDLITALGIDFKIHSALTDMRNWEVRVMKLEQGRKGKTDASYKK